MRNHETDVWLEGIRAPFEHELDAVRERLAEMAGSVDSMLEASVLALMKHDATPVERVFAEDDTVDELDSSIETDCLRLIALRRPVGRDLRFLGAAIKMVTDLERIGDHAVDVARLAQSYVREPHPGFVVDLLPLSHAARGMLKGSLEALITHDVEKAKCVIEDDEVVDDVYHRLTNELYEAMRENPECVVPASLFLFAAYYLERVGDHAVNIAERAVYVDTGRKYKEMAANSLFV